VWQVEALPLLAFRKVVLEPLQLTAKHAVFFYKPEEKRLFFYEGF
jgi:hypothetical protein